MDINVIVIGGVCFASLVFLLIITKFFRRKTFDDVIAEKKAITAGLKAQSALGKKPKKLQQLKKEQKREKKQRQKETKQQLKELIDEDSDSNQNTNDEGTPEMPTSKSLPKAHVEFEAEPEIVTYNAAVETKVKTPPALGEKKSNKKDKKSQKPSHGNAGILINKNDPIAVKEASNAEEPSLNTFDIKPPKDIVELKKHEKEKEKEKKEDKSPNRSRVAQSSNQSQPQPQRKEKAINKKERNHSNDKAHSSDSNSSGNLSNGANSALGSSTLASASHSSSPSALGQTQTSIVEAPIQVLKEIKQNNSPKNQPKDHHHQQQQQQQNAGSTKTSKQTQKKQHKDSAATKELVNSLDKLSDNDTIGVQLLMNLFRKADLNRSEIQLLIDYLLNKQQDMPATHSEWSDDVCTKLKRQLQEKEKALTESQEASAGIQAKLRELRAEINNERIQMNASNKIFNDKLAAKDQEIHNLSQEVQALNEKLNVERQQFQAKVLQEKQANNAELLQQIQILKNDLTHKEHCCNELTQIVNASQQSIEELQEKNEIINQQNQQINNLEQQRNELEESINNQIFELEKLRILETENTDYKLEVANSRNSLESAKKELLLLQEENNHLKHDLSTVQDQELSLKQQEIENLAQQNSILSQKIEDFSIKLNEQNNVESSLQATLDSLQKSLQHHENLVRDLTQSNDILSQQVSTLQEEKDREQNTFTLELEASKKDLNEKLNLLNATNQDIENLKTKEADLLQQIKDLRQRNDDLRTKNWKLIEALQNAEATIKKQKEKFSTPPSSTCTCSSTTCSSTSSTITSATTASTPPTATSSAHNDIPNANTNSNLVEQQLLLVAAQKPLSATISTNTEKLSSSPPAASTTGKKNEEEKIREILERLYPEAVKACANTALSASFEQWVEHVLNKCAEQASSKKQSTSTNTNSSSSSSSDSNHNNNNSNINILSSNNKSTQSNSNHFTTSVSTNTTTEAAADSTSNHHLITTNNGNGNGPLDTSSSCSSDVCNDSCTSSNSGVHENDNEKVQRLYTQNLQLRAQVDSLTNLVTKTSNTLSDLEIRAQAQEDYWKNLLKDKEKTILSLQHTNGEQGI